MAGRLTFELFESTCPVTCENFKCLLTGEKGKSTISQIPLHYKGSKVHRVFSDYILQAGDFTRGDGRGGETISGVPLPDEDRITQVFTPTAGLLAMANIPEIPSSATSQFFITLTASALPHLDGKYTIFGHVKSGKELLTVISKYGDPLKGLVNADITISDCGISDKLVFIGR